MTKNLHAFQGEAFAAELVGAGAAEALIPLLDPRFELIRIEFLVSYSLELGAGGGGCYPN